MAIEEIRIHAIVTNDDNAGPNAPTLTEAQIQNILNDANTLYSSAGIKFVLDGIEKVNSTVLNRDKPPPTNDGAVTANARQERAVQYPGKLVIFFRDGGGGGSGADGEFLYTAKTDDLAQGRRLFTHEVGHYLHLAHTFGTQIGLTEPEQSLPDDQKINLLKQRQREAILNYVQSGQPKENGLAVFDGDAPAVGDTPADDGGQIIYYLNGGNSAGPIDSVDIEVSFPDDPTPHHYLLKPDRGNIMSYFHKELSIPQHLSNDQCKRIRHALEIGNRLHLIKGATWADPETQYPVSPTVVSWGPGHLDLFVRGADRRIKHKAWNADPGEWWPNQTGWQDLGDVGLERPAAVSWGPRHVDLFSRTIPKWTVQHKSWDSTAGNWWPGPTDWQELGGQGIGRPVPVSWGPGRLDLFARFTDGKVRNKVWENGNWWPGQTSWQDLGGTGVGAPAVVAWGPGHLDVFIRGANGNVLHKAWNADPGEWWPSQTDWQDLGGSIIGSPSAISWGVGRVDLFVRGSDGRIYNKVWEQERGTWWPDQKTWQDLGGAGVGPPTVVTWGPGHIDVFMRGGNGNVLHKAWNADPGEWWPNQTGWQDLGGKIIGFPAAVSWGAGRVDLFVRGSDRRIYNKVWEQERGTWWPNQTGWQDLGLP